MTPMAGDIYMYEGRRGEIELKEREEREPVDLSMADAAGVAFAMRVMGRGARASRVRDSLQE